MDNDKLDMILAKMQVMHDEIRELNQGMSRMENKLNQIEAKVDALEARIDKLEVRMDAFETRMDALTAEVQDLAKRVRKIELYQENELNKSIALLCENHIDLIKKLNLAIKVEDGNKIRDVQLISLNHRIDLLEDDMTHVKDRLSLT